MKNIKGAEIPGAKVLQNIPVAGITKIRDIRYPENPQQVGIVGEIADFDSDIANCANMEFADHGKMPSFNNYLDIDAALNILREFDKRQEAACVIVKHRNPCGFALDKDSLNAYANAFRADSLSAFGGIIGFTRTVNYETAAEINKQFAEIVIAPFYTEAAMAELCKKKNLRIATMTKPLTSDKSRYEFRSVSGLVLAQEVNDVRFEDLKFEFPTIRKPTAKEMADLAVAFYIAKHGISNAVAFVMDKRLVAGGYGQQSRIDSVKAAFEKARSIAEMQKSATLERPLFGTVFASDSFFPDPDCVEFAGRAGATAVVHPGGSIKDKDAIEAANRYHMAMVLTGLNESRTFKH